MTTLTSRSRARHHGASVTADHYVYRCYDSDDVLLYIGCTMNVRHRMSDHRRGEVAASRWLAVCMARYEVVGPFSGREAGRAAERTAIVREKPVFNSQERGLPITLSLNGVAEYLIKHGHIELAERTACTCWPEDKDAGGVSPWCAAHNLQARPS